MRRRATLADVAALAGVSKMSASRALRGAGDVSRATLDKVLKAAHEIGYTGNPLAASLSGQRSDLIGVVVPSVSNIVFAEVLAGIAEGIEGSGLQPVFGVTDYDPDREHEVIAKMLSWRPSGLIVTGLDQWADTRALLAHSNIPVVQIMDLDGTPVDACVGFSQSAAGAAMADAMVGAGYRRIGYVGCNLGRDTRARKRATGFSARLASRGLALAGSVQREAPSTTKLGREMTADLLAAHPSVDCIYYSNDDLAAGGAFHCLATGIDVPGDLCLAGFNGLELIESLPVPLATSITPRREIGKRASEILRDAAREGRAKTGQRVELVPRLTMGD
jgi:LacI family gluconate utilization system Gnt-I transcriptional repressor